MSRFPFSSWSFSWPYSLPCTHILFRNSFTLESYRACTPETPISPLLIINNQRLLIIKPKSPDSFDNRKFEILKVLLDDLCVHGRALFLGTVAGINLADGVGCSQQNFMCQNFRFKQPKVDYQK